jgi:hypothetical protein
MAYKIVMKGKDRMLSKHIVTFWVLMSVLVLSSCDDSSSPQSVGDQSSDSFTNDMRLERLDHGAGADIDYSIDQAVGGTMTDMNMPDEGLDQNFFPDAELSLDAMVDPPSCESAPDIDTPIPSLEQKKFALSLFHFNLQYVIGGLYYDDDQGERRDILDNAAIGMGWNNDRLEDWIITETFNPILELYQAHPDWSVTIELQGYMLEVLAERHLAILNRLREMAQTGQVEVVSFHYAAQLFLAFPKEDLVRSIRKTKEIFASYCIPLSGVVFNQEGQAGPGRQRVLLEEGYIIGVFPKNLFRYAQGEVERWPYYQQEGGDLIVGPAGYDPQSGIQVAWTFFDDGELRAVREAVNPYSAPLGGRDQARLDEYEAQIQDLVEQGYLVSTITSYVAHLKAQEVEQPEAPPLVDGTWQPPSTDSIHRWLGGRSQFFVGAEEDTKIRSGNMVVREAAAAVQVLYEEAVSQGLGSDRDWVSRLDRMWRNVWHSQVSDFTGVNPWRGEIVYGLRMNRWLRQETLYLRTQLLDALGWDFVKVDLKERTAVPSDGIPIYEAPDIAEEGYISADIIAMGRQINQTWYRLADQHYLLDLHISEQVEFVNEMGEDIDGAEIQVSFPRTEEVLEYSPGLIEDEVYRHELSEFNLLLDHIYLPLPNGLIGIGDGWYIIKDTKLNHVAGRVTSAPTIDFIDRAIQTTTPARWQFHLVYADADEALEIANRLNIYPIVYYTR